MTTPWVDDIIQALKNLGGRATLEEIYAEVRKIRKDELPRTFDSVVRERLEFHSSDSESFHKRNRNPGKDFFQRVGKGTWALRDSHLASFHQPIRIEHIQIEHARQKIPLQAESQPLAESFETISNIFRTIKEYRDYSDPGTPAWRDYVRELFHLMGFNTEELDERLFALKNMGGEHALALVIYVQPGEDIENLVPGLLWGTHLKYAASYHQIFWGILTNGLQIKLFDYHGPDQHPFHWPDFDGMLLNEKLDSFFTVYKQFSAIRQGTSKLVSERKTSIGATQNAYLAFFSDLLARLKEARPGVTQASKTLPQNSFSFSSGHSGFPFGWVLPKEKVLRVELYIDVGDLEKNKGFFDALLEDKKAIELEIGSSLDWKRLNNRRASRISISIPFMLAEPAERHEIAKRWGVEMMLKFVDAFKPRIKAL